MAQVCQRSVLLTANQHNSNTGSPSNHDRRRLLPTTTPTSGLPASAVSARRHKPIGCLFHRHVQLSSDSLTTLTSTGHLRSGQYYRWNPDISRISNALSPLSDDSAASSSPWQRNAFLCSDGDNTSPDVTCPRVRQQAVGDDVTARTEACRRLLNLETRYVNDMADGLVEFVRPLRGTLLSQSDSSTLFQNVEKLVRLSDYHISLMSVEGDVSLQSVGIIYQPRIHILSEAYTEYVEGLVRAYQFLRALPATERFVSYIEKTGNAQNYTERLTTFLERPSSHILDLSHALREVLHATWKKHADFSYITVASEELSRRMMATKEQLLKL